MDRTAEFSSFLRQGSAQIVSVTAMDESSNALAHFNAAAAELGSALHRAQLKLTELGKSAKSKSLFNDQSGKFNEMTMNIKQDIALITERVGSLTTAADSADNRQIQQHCRSVTSTLNARLTDLTRSFRDVLELRTKTMQELETRRGKYSASTASIGANTFGNKQDMDLESGKSLEAAQILNNTSTYHLSRADAARNLQGIIAEIGQMFNKMSHMIVQQEEMVQRIDQDITGSLDHVNEGHSELLKYFNSISGNRSLILKVFAILIAFIIIFAIFS